MRKLNLLLAFILLSQSFLFSQEKKIVDPSIYDDWKSVSAAQISSNGNFVSFEINPQVGDGNLYVKNIDGTNERFFPRGSKAQFSDTESFIAFQVEAEYKKVRDLKLKKKKKDDLPKDSLFILNLKNGEIQKYPNLISKEIAIEKSDWMAFLVKPEEPKKDTTKKEEKKKPEPKKKAPKDDPKTNTLMLVNPASGASFEFKNVVDFSIARNGKLIGFSTFKRDSLASSKLFIFDTKKENATEVFSLEGFIEKPTADNGGSNIAFLSSIDTAKRKLYSLQLYTNKNQTVSLVSDTNNAAFTNDFSPSKNGRIYFSRNDEKLYFGVASKPEKEIKDTLLPEEKVNIDLWHWNDPYLQPQQLVQLKRELSRTYLSVFHLKSNKLIQLATEEMEDVRPMLKGNSDIALGSDNRAYRKRSSWESPGYRDVFAVDVQSGKKTILLQEIQSQFGLSPNGKYVYWYANEDSCWYAKPIAGGSTVLLNRGMDFPLYDESHDYPQDPSDYGIAGWTADDKNIIFYDKFDLWLADPTGKENAKNLTQGFGRKNNTELRFLELDEEAEWIDTKAPLFLRAQDKTSKEAASYQLDFKSGKITELTKGGFRYYPPTKAKYANLMVWRRGNLSEYYNLWSSTTT
ncbi:MAG: hypothetical protein JW729_00190, partial [Bacteroidales bacterium]|nr:hypothetical protein [Bacteroidales bacterium]